MVERRLPAASAREHVEDMLDEALMQTFPASDPVTLKSCVEPSAEGQATERTPRPDTCDTVPRGTGVNDGRARAGKGGAARGARRAR